MPRELSVILYDPGKGEYRHWSLFLKNEENERGDIYEAVGDATDYFYNTLGNILPQGTRRYYTQVGPVAINNNQVENLEDVLSCVEIRHNDTSWCCQNWIYDALDALNDEKIISDDELAEFKQNLNPHFWEKFEKKQEETKVEDEDDKQYEEESRKDEEVGIKEYEKEDEEENGERDEGNGNIQREWKCCNCEVYNDGGSGYCCNCGHSECEDCPSFVWP